MGGAVELERLQHFELRLRFWSVAVLILGFGSTRGDQSLGLEGLELDQVRPGFGRGASPSPRRRKGVSLAPRLEQTVSARPNASAMQRVWSWGAVGWVRCASNGGGPSRKPLQSL